MKQLIFIIGVSFLLKACLPVRTIVSPKMTGYVFDIDRKAPIGGCYVNGVYTNSEGYYKLKRISYLEFVPIFSCRTYVFPTDTVLVVQKDCNSDTINIYKSIKQRNPKNTHWQMDTIFLETTECPSKR